MPLSRRPARQLAILTCMDARLDLFRALGLELGHANIVRNAGGRVTSDAIHSLAISARLLGVREIGVVHHTGCGLQGITNEELVTRTGLQGVDFRPFGDVQQSVREDVAALRGARAVSTFARIWGAVYDIDTDKISYLDPSPTAG